MLLDIMGIEKQSLLVSYCSRGAAGRIMVQTHIISNAHIICSLSVMFLLTPLLNIKIDQASAQYVKIQLRDQDCLQLGEVKVYGYPATEGFPIESLDKLTLGNDAARCWQTKGSRIMLTSDTHAWDDSHTTLVEGSPSAGVLAVLPLAKKKTAVDETFGYPDFAVEVALLDRKLVVKGEKETGDHEKIGGHLIVLHTPMVKQHLEGAMFVNFGQQTRLGRYPLHFHMSECVHGSTLAKNVIWKSNQRCIVVHGTHNLTLSENVAYDTRGHCFMLEDGGGKHFSSYVVDDISVARTIYAHILCPFYPHSHIITRMG